MKNAKAVRETPPVSALHIHKLHTANAKVRDLEELLYRERDEIESILRQILSEAFTTEDLSELGKLHWTPKVEGENVTLVGYRMDNGDDADEGRDRDQP